MDGMTHPNMEYILRSCRQYVYADEAAAKIATFIHENATSTEEVDRGVLTYLVENRLYAPGWDNIAARLKVQDAHTQIAFDTLDVQAQRCLRLRTLDGYSIPEIAAKCTLKEKVVHAVLKAARHNFWKAFVVSEAHVLHKCRQFVYSDTDAMDAAIAICSQNCPFSLEVSSADVIVYLGTNPVSSENWDTLAVHLEELDDAISETAVQEAFDTLEESEIALLRLRVGDGHAIAAIAKTLDYTEADVEASLITYRAKFWSAVVEVDGVVLRECRRLIHDDIDAKEIAVIIQKRGVPVENVRQHIYNYLVARWDVTPAWDDPAFMKVVAAVVNPTEKKVAGFEAAKTAYNLLEYPEQDVLKFKVVEGLSDEIIAQVSMKHLEQVKREATSAKDIFWKHFTRERWSTLTYFIEKLCEEDDSSSTGILKVEAEYLAAEEAYNSLNETDKDVLKQRCLQGLSVGEIAAKQRTSPVEIAETLTKVRDEFYEKFLAEIYRLWVIGIRRVGTDEVKTNKIKADEDDVGNAWTTLQEQFYKFVPNNFRGWLTTSARRSKLDLAKEEHRHKRIAEEHGRTYINTDIDTDINTEGEFVTVVSTTEDILQPHEALAKERAEKKELKFWKNERKCWHTLLTKTAAAILKSKKPEKKLFLLTNYILQPKLNELRTAKPGATYEFQHPGEAMAIAHVTGQYQSKVTQTWIGEVIDATDRSIRRYTDEIIPLVERYAEEVGISTSELVEGCAAIKERDATEKLC